ncbi:carbohydrate-binding module family 35 protein [Xylaria bambusicola]|uniref:carbohydrate-binding module family 35 protein n=1 Tax=Xylaria bambusicola TaxID=326684 RepID=UPI0020082ABD|nr:carbohydrate-binding module family 35 protein [Xylaria bambusicola]KAI0505928.1 carbohydrate-binding module family 35 protein [Xylaria bambusicola]
MLFNISSLRASLLLLVATTASATLQIIPGSTWTATNTGAHVQAHGAGIIKVGSTYYMVGEDKTSGSAFQNINCYSSTNLVEWTYVGALLSRTSSGDLGPNRVVERPKVIYNDSTKQYVLYMHIDSSNYGEAKVGVATGNSVCGSYTYRGSFQPLGHQSRDLGLFKDDDGSAYLLTEDRANGLRIEKLSADYLSVASSTYLWPDSIEAPAILKRQGTYYMFGSKLTGWDPNDNVYSTARSLSGPWSAWKTFADSGSKTYSSQTTFILPFGNDAIYLGDRWVSSNLMRSTYVWLPLAFSGTTVSMKNYVNWTPDVSAGTWAAAPSESQPEAESATIANGARTLSCSGCSGGTSVGYIGGSAGGSVTFSGITSSASTRTSIRIRHLNGDSAQRFATVTVNGVGQKVAFLPTDGGSTPGTSVLNANLNSGSSNTVVITTTDGTWGPDVDRIMVPDS